MVWSKETIAKMSENQKGEKTSFYGQKHTEESLNKISNSSKGSNNPNYGANVRMCKNNYKLMKGI